MNHIKALYTAGVCRSCGRKLTKEDYDQFKGAWTDQAPIPGFLKRYIKQFCKTCIAGYKLRAMNSAQRIDFIRESAKQLEDKTLTQKEIEDSKRDMKQMGLTDEEITIILKKVRTA